jgi:hypothetical protein
MNAWSAKCGEVKKLRVMICVYIALGVIAGFWLLLRLIRNVIVEFISVIIENLFP